MEEMKWIKSKSTSWCPEARAGAFEHFGHFFFPPKLLITDLWVRINQKLPLSGPLWASNSHSTCKTMTKSKSTSWCSGARAGAFCDFSQYLPPTKSLCQKCRDVQASTNDLFKGCLNFYSPFRDPKQWKTNKARAGAFCTFGPYQPPPNLCTRGPGMCQQHPMIYLRAVSTVIRLFGT